MRLNTPESFMNRALELAQEAANDGEVPVGALIVRNGEIVCEARNEKEASGSAVAHAELLAIEKACEILGRWRLTDCELYVTLEPCLMCCGAVLQARLAKVVYGASDPKFGAVESLYETLTDSRSNHRCEVLGGVMADESVLMLKTFFRERR